MTTPSPAIPDGERLLPCPNGHIGKAVCSIREDGMYGVTTYEVFCCDCHWRIADQDTKAEAISAWNTRPSPARESVRVTEVVTVPVLHSDWRVHDFAEFAARDAGIDLDTAFKVGHLAQRMYDEAALRVEPAAQPAYRAVTLEDANCVMDALSDRGRTGVWDTELLRAMTKRGLVVPVGEPGGKGEG